MPPSLQFSTAKTYARRWAEPAVIATVAVAILALIIQQNLGSQANQLQTEIAKQEKLRASVARSVALYQDFVESDAVKELRRIHYEIEHVIWANGDLGEPKNRSIVVFHHPLFSDKIRNIRRSLVGLLQRFNLIYKCGNLEAIYETVHVDTSTDSEGLNGEALCDQSTISLLLGSMFFEFFFTFRPMVYCDEFFKDNYSGEEERSRYVDRWEALVEDHLVRDMHGVEHQVFKNEEQWESAIAAGEWSKQNKNYSVLQLSETRCELYEAGALAVKAESPESSSSETDSPQDDSQELIDEILTTLDD